MRTSARLTLKIAIGAAILVGACSGKSETGSEKADIPAAPPEYGITLVHRHEPAEYYHENARLDQFQVIVPGEYDPREDQGMPGAGTVDRWIERGCDEIYRHLRSEYNAYDYDSTPLTLRIAGASEGYVITNVRASVEMNSPELVDGTIVTCYASGRVPEQGLDDRSVFAFQLNAKDPQLRYVADGFLGRQVVEPVFGAPNTLGRPPSRPVEPGIPQEFLLLGIGGGCSCTWHVEVQIEVDGRRTWYRIPDPSGLTLATSGQLYNPSRYWTLRTVEGELEGVTYPGELMESNCLSGSLTGGCVAE